MGDHPEAAAGSFYPLLQDFLPLFRRQGGKFTGCAAYEHPPDVSIGDMLRITVDNGVVDIAIGMHGSEGGCDQSFQFLIILHKIFLT